MTPGPVVHEAFGLRIASELPLPELPEVGRGAAPDLLIALASADDVRGRFSGSADPPAVSHAEHGDGGRSRVERGRAGDLLLTYDGVSELHLRAGGGRLVCATPDPQAPAWRRFVLDTGLATAALVHGYEALHAGAFGAPGEGIVAIAAATAGGKSSLLGEMLRRGATMFCDDILVMSQSADGGVVGHPGPPLLNLAAPPDDVLRTRLGARVIAELGGEWWTALSTPPPPPAPVEAVVLLERGAERPAAEELEASSTPLLAHSLASGRDPHRLARRFSLFAALANQARLIRLAVPGTMPPPAIADLLEAHLAAQWGVPEPVRLDHRLAGGW